MTDHSAYLVFGSQLLRPSKYKITVVNYTQGYNVTMTSATVRRQKLNYPVRIKESDFQFSIQCRSINEYDTLKKEVRTSHLKSLENATQGICRFIYPELEIDYLGYISQAPEGVRRFEYTPTLPLTMLLLKDTVNTLTAYTLQNVNWQDIYGTNLADLSTATSTSTIDLADGIASANKPPTTGANPGSGVGGGRGPIVK